MSDFENQNEEPVVEAVVEEVKQSSVFAIISMICGILSILCCCLSYVAIVIGVAAVVLGIISIRKEEPKKGMAIAGIICGGVGLVIVVILIAWGNALMNSGLMDSLPAQLQEMMDQNM